MNAGQESRRLTIWFPLAAALVSAVALACAQDRPGRQANAAGDSATVARAPTVDTGTQAWLGYKFGRLTDSVAVVGGDTMMVGDTTFDVRFVLHRSHHMLWISSGSGRRVAEEWTILSVLPLPKPVEDERMYIGHCRIDGKRVHHLVALGFWDDGPLFKRINRAWRVNLGARTFDEIPVKGVDCLKLGGGE